MGNAITNTQQVASQDRVVVGPQPDQSTPTGTIPVGTVQNGQLAAMVANSVKANVTAAAASPTDVPLAASTLFGRGSTGNAGAQTAAQAAAIIAGAAPFTGTVTLAKLTSGGSNGSLTVVNGLITGYTAPS